MNCQEIGNILNDQDIGALSPAVVTSAREHLATCDECARDWKAHEQMLAMPMPVPGPGLLEWRPANRGVSDATSRRSLRGTLLLGALIAVGAAAAVYVAVEQSESMRTTESRAAGPTSDVVSPQDEPVGAATDSSPDDEQPGSIATGADASPATNPPDVAPVPEPVVDSTIAAVPPETIAAVPPETTAAVCSRTATSSGTLKVVLLPARASTPDRASEALVQEIRQDTLRALLAMPAVEVVDLGPVDLAVLAPNAGSLRDDNLLFIAISQRYQSTVVAEISERTTASGLSWSIDLLVRQRESAGGSANEISKDGSPAISSLLQTLGVKSLGTEYAGLIARRAARPPILNLMPDACNVFLDASRPENERLQALAQLRNDGLDGETLAVAVALAVESPSARTRQRVWSLLRGSEYHPPLAGLLSSALVSDADAAVRKEAALGLAAYLREGSTLAVLEHAAGNDVSTEVRLAARMAMMSYDEQLAFKREILLDRSLTPAERFAPTSNFTTLRMPVPLTYHDGQAEEALAYSEILGATDDPQLENSVLSELSNTIIALRTDERSNQIDVRIIPVLAETVASDDPRVRRQAIRALISLAEFPEARAALESVIENYPELAADMRIEQVLAPQPVRRTAP
jgi:hypothetical protein